jgi:uncharacterized membrane protein
MRYLFIDNLRGIAFLLMIIHHIFYFKDVSNGYSTSYADNTFVKSSGIIARTLFIFLVGLSLSITDKKDKKSIKKRIKRSAEILIHALIISFISYMFYPDIFIRFGVLHFIAVASLLGSYFVDKKKLTFVCMFLFAILKPLSVNNTFIDTITGAKINYNMMDHFPLFPWFGLVLFGLFIGKNIDLSKIEKTLSFINYNPLTKIGQNCLNLYTAHVVFLIIIYNIKNITNK